ncbi:hypothetical protein PHET_04525 [Paragonimus heterotremus]|uniref:C2H2-type domain-containing protein n=1 Tax=Paragonimus heterotremus TaxID=100268 RepID=A0A8J4SQD7_9TREM|nr:hypothetical protein PHET_04525 [Paragonimus heterotremus]
MEIGPELCLWTGGNQAVQKESGSRSHYCPPFSGLPSNQTQPFHSSQFAGVVLELESDSDLESEDDEQWDSNATLEIFRNDLRNTATDSIITLEIPAESNTACHSTPVDSEQVVQVSLDDPLDTCISVPQESNGQDRNAATVALNKKIGPDEVRPSGVSSSQQQGDHSTRIATRSSEIANTNTISIENSGDKNLTESDSVDRNTPLGPLVLQTLTSSIQCPKCQRYFVDRRSMNIHSTKAHSGKRTSETKSHPVSAIDSDRIDETANRSSGTIDDNISPISSRVDGSARSSQCSPVGPIQAAGDKPGDSVQPSGLAAPTPPSSPAASVSSLLGSAATKPNLSPTSCGIANLPKRRISYTVSSSAVPLSDSGSLKLRLVSVASAKRSKLLEASPQPTHAHKMDLLESKTTPIPESQESDGPVCVSSTPEKCAEMMDCTVPNQTTESPCSSSGKQSSNVQLTQVALATEETKREEDAAANTRINRLKRLRALPRPRTRSTRAKIIRAPVNPNPIETSRTGGPKLRADVPVVKSSRLPAASQSEEQTNSSSRPILDTSLRTADGSYRCRLCKRVFPNRFSLTGHYKSHYVESQKPYHCEDCEQRYTSPSNLHYHRSRNCPFVKLREMNNGASVARSPRSMKLIQAKIKRINERRAILHQFELSDSTSAKMPAEMKEQPMDTATSSGTPPSSNLKVLSDRSDSIPLKPCTQILPTPQETKMKEAHNDNQLTTLNEVVVCSGSASEPKARNLSPNRILNSPKRAASKVPSVSSAPSSCKTGSCQAPIPISSASSESTNCNVSPSKASVANAEHQLNSDLNSSTLQLQLKNLLERACQSDLARERILAFTSAALLSALGPLANSKTQQNGCVAENLKKTDTNITLPTSLLANFTELLHMTNSNGQPDHEVYDCGETNVEQPESCRRPDSSSTNSVFSSIPARPSPILQIPANAISSSSMTTSLRPQSTDLNSRSYSCPHFCHPRAVFPDPQSLDKHIFQAHSSRLHSTRTSPLLNVSSSNPPPYDLHQIIGFNFNNTQRPPILSPLRSEASNRKLAGRDDLIRSVSDSPCLVACTECDRLFSSFTACRVHYTKSHQNNNRSRPPTITITELGASGQQPVKFRWHDHQPDGKR